MTPQRLETIAQSIRYADPTAKVSVAIVVETEDPIWFAGGGSLLDFINATADKEGMTVVPEDFMTIIKPEGGEG